MIQFTAAEVETLRDKAKRQPAAVRALALRVQEVMEREIIVPESGIANWTLYYYCPECSVELEFDRNNRYRHRCPSCRKMWSGEPYDSTWWGFINAHNYIAAFEMGLLYQISEDQAYARKAIAIMLEYSKYYQGYEVHGDIPYNGPGKSGAQTLDEANFLRSFAMTYDLLAEVMTPEEREAVKTGMLIPGAEFLMAHRHNQLHNHEVIIGSAIAVIGLIFGNEEYVQFAVYEPYGILYQLEHGMLENRMWFEGAFGYHFYALESFFAYEKFALHTPHSLIKHKNYQAMMELLISYLEPGFRIPMLNDTNYRHTSGSLHLYEFAYRELGGEKLLYILNQMYRQQERDNLEAFIYGVEELPACSLALTNYHIKTGRSGSTVLRGRDNRYLLFKHDSYGGEHDHYDRLAVSYLAYDKRIAPDLGTTGYGAVMHYDYYKNTGTHNTVTVGEENQAPVNAVLTRYEEQDGVIYVEAKADWTAPYQMPDSFTIVQWSEENYRTVTMERKLAWTEDYFAELFIVKGVRPELSIDWVMHISGEPDDLPDGEEVPVFSDKKPYKYLHNIRRQETGANMSTQRAVYTDGGVTTQIFSAAGGQTFFHGKGPDNPSVSEINYQIERVYGGEAIFAHVITSSDRVSLVESVDFKRREDGLVMEVTAAGGAKRFISFRI